MCGSPIIQQQSTAHKDVTQRLTRKQRPAPKVALQRPPQKKLNKGLQFDFDRAIIIYQTRPYSSAG